MTRKEFNAVHAAQDYVINLLESCSNDEGSQAINDLNECLNGLRSLIVKQRLAQERYRRRNVQQRVVKVLSDIAIKKQAQ